MKFPWIFVAGSFQMFVDILYVFLLLLFSTIVLETQTCIFLYIFFLEIGNQAFGIIG
jgi:hypothetical protein